MDISVIVITHDNFTAKNGCLESVLISLQQQKIVSYEVVVVDNRSDDFNRAQLKNLENRYSEFKYIYSNENNISVGRNIGAQEAKSELLLFVDDDMILIGEMTLYKVFEYSKCGCYGLGAERLWTVPEWYEKNKDETNDCIRNHQMGNILVERPNPAIRQKINDRHIIKTYIGNFGFIKKQNLEEIGFWSEKFEGYGGEDDELIFRLYMKYGKPVLLRNIEVIHVSHNISEICYNNINNNTVKIQKILDEYSIKVFHIGKLMYGEEGILEYY